MFICSGVVGNIIGSCYIEAVIKTWFEVGAHNVIITLRVHYWDINMSLHPALHTQMLSITEAFFITIWQINPYSIKAILQGASAPGF